MKTYKVKYTFRGWGIVEIKAKNENEAREIFYEGEYENEIEIINDINCEDIEELN